MFGSCLSEVREALHFGIDYANEAQPDPVTRDPWFWSHSARYATRNRLQTMAAGADGWSLVASVPNSGIHLRIGELHVVRVLRSVSGTTPSPGRNRTRRQAWQQCRLRFPAGNEMGDHRVDSIHDLPPLNLVLDWMTNDDALVMHLGLPRDVWGHGSEPVLHWRVPLNSADDLEGLAFSGTEDTYVPVRLRVDDAEMEAM